MSTTIVKQAGHIQQRKAEVAEIVGRHSRALFGHSNATITEVRNEAIRKRLEAIYNV